MKTLLVAALLSGTALLPSAADAAPLRFTLSGAVDASFSLDSNPAPVSWSNIYTEFRDVAATVNGVATTFQFLDFCVYGVNGVEGGLAASRDFQTLFDLSGTQLFSGLTRSPMFVAGTYDLTGPGGASTLTISAVPVPAAAPLFGAALLALGVAGYGVRRRTTGSAS